MQIRTGEASLIRPTRVPPTAWVNGGGVSRLLCVRGSWRISLAEISGTQSFSQFPGMDRVLIPLDPGGVTLFMEGRVHQPGMHRPCSFLGETRVVGMSAQPIRVLNIMTVREEAELLLEIREGVRALPELPHPGARPHQRTETYVLLGGKLRLGDEHLPPGTIILPEHRTVLSGEGAHLAVLRWVPRSRE